MSKVLHYPLCEEYKKDTGITPEDVRMFREWLVTQPHLPNEHITDLDLILIYDSCERSFILSKELLDIHFTLKTHMNDFFKDRSFDNRIETALNCSLITPLPTKSKEGYACIYCGDIDNDIKNYNFKDGIRALFMILDLWQYEEGTWPGIIFILDLQGLTVGHISKFELQTLQEFMYMLQEGTLFKLKSIHVINATSVLETIMLLIKPFLKKSTSDLLHIHPTGSKVLEQFYPMDELPKEAGGKYKSIEEYRGEIKDKLKSSSEYFLLENRKRVKEAQRLEKPKKIADFYGSVEGSFKKLNVD